MKKIALIVIVLLLSVQSLFSQELLTYTPVSPNAASFAKYGSYPINLNSGVPQILIPIHTIKQGNLKVPINISYHASGIKVNEQASMVGLGWSLNAGGIIVRQVRGIPDEYTSSPFIDADSATQDLDTYLGFQDIYYKRKDSSPDIYIYNFNGVTGRFYIENGEIISESSSSMKIERKGQELFVIIMPDGTQYRFGTSLDGASAYEFSDKRTGTTYSLMEDMITSWYLTEIVSANKTDTISFKYKDNNFYKNRELVGSTIKLSSLRYGFIGFGCDWRFSVPQSSVIGSYSRNPTEVDDYSEEYFISGKIIDTIVFKSGIIKFNTTITPWWDNSAKLDSLEIIDNNQTPYLKASFQYDGSNQDRMKLNSLSFSGRDNNEEKKHEFIYNNLNLPSRNSEKQDYWGYANNNTGGYVERQEVEFLEKHYILGNGNKSTNEHNMKAGIIEKIIYPTGGYTKFEFEANKILPEPVPTIIYPSENINVQGYMTRGVACDTDPHEKTKSIFIPQDGFIKINASLTPAQQNSGGPKLELRGPSGGALKTYTRPAPDPGQTYFPGRTVSEEIWVPSGNYTLYARETAIGGIGAHDCPVAGISVSWREVTVVDINPPLKDVGGLRIKTIKNYDGVSNTPSTIKSYEYSQGFLKTPFNKSLFTKYFINYSPTPIDDFNIGTSLELFIHASSSPLYEIESNGVSHIEYQEVTEYLIDSNSNKNGKTIYYFDTTPSLEFNVLQPFFNPVNITFAQPYRTFFNYLSRNKPPYYLTKPWSGGQLRKKEIYSLSNTGQYKRISTLENKYEKNVNEKTLKPLLLYNLISPLEQNCSSPTYYYSYLFGNGFISTGKKLLTSTINRQYDSNGENPVASTKNYTYNSNYLVSETTTTNSKGQTIKSKTHYPNDVDSAISLDNGVLTTSEMNAISLLQTPTVNNPAGQHRIATPIQTEKTVKDPNGVLLSKNTQKTSYKNWGANLVLPESVKTLKGEYSTSNAFEDRILFHDYDDYGNPLEVSKTDGTHIVYIWGYNQSQPIAKIENANYSDIENRVANLQALSNADDDRTVDILKTNGTLTKVGKEGDLREALRNLRISLPNALVTTYTYDPLIGVTSITDPRGQTVYYEYDPFNRLKHVKDQDGNILSQNDYNYKN
ncbi:RHS repeat protein [Flavobacteriaceae bacterium]|nr:RHS repeat protein [Flavobacteriaceae bacterium]